MDPESFQHLMDLVGEAATRPAEERDDYLAKACGADEVLLVAARALLARSTATPGATAGLMARVAGAAAAADSEAMPERIGHYRILSTLGSGQSLDHVSLIDLRGKFVDYESTLFIGN